MRVRCFYATAQRKTMYLHCNSKKKTYLCSTIFTSMPARREKVAEHTEIYKRDEELYKAFLRAYSLPKVSYREAINIAIHTQTSKYWLSEYSTWREFLSRERGTVWNGKWRKSCRLDAVYEQLYRQYIALRNGGFHNKSSFFIVCFLINRPASGFFISYYHARKIIHRMRKRYAKR